MKTNATVLRTAFLEDWYEHVVFNAKDIDGDKVIAQGQSSGKFYILTLDGDTVVEAYLHD